MKSYFGIFKMEFKGELQYRAKALAGIATQLFWGLLQVYLYTAFLNSGSVDGFSISQMASYIWLGQAFFALRYVTMPKRVGQEITNGNVCYKFVRPIGIYNQWYAEGIAQKLAATLLRFAPIIIIGFLLPKSIALSLPVSVGAFFLFLLALILGLFMSHSLSMFAVYLTFKTLSEKGSLGIVSSIVNMLGGLFIPLPILPQALQEVLRYLPFSYITDLPFRIYIGNVGIIDGLIYIGIGFAWLVAIIAIGKLLIGRALKKTVVQGG